MLLLPACSGCLRAGAGPTTRPAPLTAEQIEARRNLEANILNIYAYYDPYNPWTWNESRSRVTGIRVNAMYLEGPKGKGVFGNGVIRPRLYVLDRKAAGSEVEPRLIKEWAFNIDDAYPFRTIQPSVQGYAYVLPFKWGDELNLAGQEVRLIITFERFDGIVVRSAHKDIRVPRGGK